MQKQKLILIGGPTAVGKTALSLRIAEMFDGEIISCDSVAVYKGMDIGSAKPTKEEQQKIKHHLIDIKSPTETYSVAEFKIDAEKVISKLSSKNKLPIVCGGTGLYMKGLLFDMQLGHSEKSNEIREKYNKLAQDYGNRYVLDILKKIDPISAEKLHEKDLLRIIRAIEIYELTGRTKSSFVQECESKYDYMLIFLNDDRKKLYERINCRVDDMFEQGLMNEVKQLISDYNLSPENQSMCAIGYKEFFEYFDNKISLDELKEKIKLNSRHYAKRQITWFKAMPDVKEYNCNDVNKILEDVKNFINN